jgi:hypothetical protein
MTRTHAPERNMSRGHQGDPALTQQVFAQPTPLVGGKNWLRHSGEAQAIDAMLLDGKYTIEEMADMIRHLSDKNSGNLPKLIQRVKQHLAHLQETWNGEMEPHHLKLRKDEEGRWSFDV